MTIPNKSILLIISICSLLCSCLEEPSPEDLHSSKVEKNESRIYTKSSSEYEHLPNPYALNVMQAVYDTYETSSTTLSATDLYVKFMPQDSAQLHSLKYDLGLELFDYPLDIELEEGDVYVPQEMPESDLAWLYTTVKPDFSFPAGIPYEILETCYIPQEGETIALTKGGEIDVEEAAFARLGYTLDGAEAGVETRASKIAPQGNIRVYCNDTTLYVPVKGVKVRCHRFVKWSTAYTDEDGHYAMSTKYRYNPHYAIVFDNCKGFDIWGNWGPLARANYNMGWHSHIGYSKDIDSTNMAWKWAVVNNAGYEYYKMCEQTGISTPPSNLKVWTWRSQTSSSAPMLRRIVNPIGINGESDWANFFINICGAGTTMTSLNFILRAVLPDITIGTGGNKTYYKIFNTVNHEMAHASHFSTVGSEFWAKYVSYIITYGAYGDGTGKNAELCGIGEMWGYAIGHIQERENSGRQLAAYPGGIIDKWIKPHVFWDLYTDGILTKKQIYDCLARGVETYDALVATMYSKYPDKADDIEQVFIDNNISINVSKPGTDGIVYDAFCVNQTVSASTSVSGSNVLSRNVTVTNGATLTLTGNNIIIESPFSVENGSNLVLLRTN